MKKLNLKFLTLALVLLLAAVAICSCAPAHTCPPHIDEDNNALCDECGKLTIDISGLSMQGAECFFDNTEHSLEIKGTLPEGVSVVYEGNGKKDAGTYTVTAKLYYGETYLEGYDLKATLKIKPLSELSIPDVTLSGKSVTYNGLEQSLAVLGVLPDDVTVEYENNNKVNAGSYDVVAKFYYKGVYIEGKDLTAVLKINKKSLDEAIADLGFASTTVAYDAAPHSILLSGALPEGISVEYVGNGVSEIGEHAVYANITLVDTQNYTLTILRREATIRIINPIVAAGLEFASKEVVYDGTAKSVTVSGLERLTGNVTFLEYVGGSETNVGTYTVTAKFAVDGVYEPMLDMTATLTIKPATVDARVENTLVEKVFDNQAVTPTIIWGNTNRDDFDVNTIGESSVKYPGEYTIRFKITPKAGVENNYKPIEDIVVTVRIAHNPGFVTEGLEYKLVDGAFVVVGYKGTAGVVVIPSTYNDGTTEAPVAIIGNSAFVGIAVEYVYIPDSVTEIYKEAFSGCDKLVSVRISDKLKAVGAAAFRGTGVREVILPDTVISIGYAAFENTESLERIRVPFVGGSLGTSNKYFGYIFGADVFAANQYKVSESLRSVTIGGAANEIPANAFYGLSGISEIIISSGVKKIGNGAFYGCSSLRDIYLPGTVTKIPADAYASASPFWGCSPELLIVFEKSGVFGEYYNYVSDEAKALVAYNKTYEDYLVNKEEYRTQDLTDATLSGIIKDGVLIEGFAPDKTEYEVESDISIGYGSFAALLSSPAATITDMQMPTVANGGRLTITVMSGDGSKTMTYTVIVKVTGDFDSDAEVVVKGGAEGTVVYVVDDGYTVTGTYCKRKLAEVANLAISFAIKTERFATLNTEVGADGITRYVMDENGNYTYTITSTNQSNIDFWRDILDSSVGRSEIVSHTHTHSTWGQNDLGGSYIYTSTSGSAGILIAPEGALSKEIFASRQILMEVLEQPGLAMVTAGIPQSGGAATLKADFTKKLTKAILRLEADTMVNVAGTTLTLASDTEMLLNPITVTIPAGTAITTAADVVDGKIAKGSVVTIENITITIPSGTVINGYNDYYYGLHEQAIEDGLLIGSRLTGGSGYVASQFANNVDLRMKLKSYMITSKVNDASDADKWIGYINSGLSKGAITAFCIHSIVADVTDAEGQGGHMISEAQADKLFAYTESLGDKVWVTTLTEAMLYYFQWSTSSVSSEYEDGSIKVSLTDKERDDIFTAPLTVKVSVPALWESAVTDGGVELEVKENDDGTRYVLVDVAPESSVILRAN